MKKPASIAMVLPVICMMLALPARAERLDIQLEVPAPLEYQDDAGYTHVRVDGYANMGRPGEPSLPGRVVQVLLPPGHEVVSLRVLPIELIPLPGQHLIFPVQKSYPPSHRGARPFTDPDPSVYSSLSAFPEHTGRASAVQSKRGFSVLPVVVRPVLYAPHSQSLSWAPAINLSVVTREAENKGDGVDISKARFRGFDRDFQALEKLVVNPETVRTYPLRIRLPKGVDDTYVIITSASLAACEGEYNLETLADEKASRGISTLIKTMEEIRAQYEGSDDAEKVRNFIRDKYENNGTDYVLLAGDADLEVVGGETEDVIVPVRGLWGNIEYGNDELNLPSDLYYACLDGTFDADLDGVWGEETDEVDLLSEVLVGRAPVDSCTEVSHFVRKTLAYRNTRDSNLKKVWLAGEWLAPESYAADMLDPLNSGMYMGGRYLSGFMQNPFFEVSTLYDRGVCEKDCWGPEEILQVMNNDIHVLHHCGHSYTNYNMRVTCDDIDAGLENTTYFFQYTGGCYPGSFDNRLDPLGGNNEVSDQDSFVEHLLLGEHGAFASIMFTRYGVGETLPKYFWDAAFGKGMKNLAEMHAYSREQVIGLIDDRYIRWQVYSLNLFGDPEASLHMSDSTEPRLGVPQNTIWFVGAQDEESPDPWTVAIRNDGEGELEWSVASDQPWLSASPDSGQAPDQMTIAVNSEGMAQGEHEGHLTVSAPGAVNPIETIDVYLYMGIVPTMNVAHVFSSPVVDGSVEANEYEDAAYLDIGFVAAGLSSARVTHNGEKLYVALLIGDDKDADPRDTLNLYFDANNDDHYPPVPGDEGLYYFDDDGYVFFVPVFDAGNGVEYGEWEEKIEGVEVAFGLEMGMRIIEMSFDLTTSHLKAAAGQSLGMGFLYWEQAGTEYVFTAAWPSLVASVGGEEPAFLGNVELEPEADRLYLTPDTLAFYAVTGAEPTAAQPLSLQVTTENEQDFTVVTSDDWILVSAESGTTPATLEIRADPSALEPGMSEGEITVIAPGAKNSPVKVPIQFEVVDRPPAFDLDSLSLSFEMIEGGALPQDQTLAIANTGGGELTWTAIPSGDWFELSAISGIAPVELTVTLNDGKLPAGQYAGVILFTAPGAEPAQVELTLSVTAKTTEPDGNGEDPAGCSCSSLSRQPLGAMLPLLLLGLAFLGRRRTHR